MIDNEPKNDDEDGDDPTENNPLLAGCRAKIPNLDLFDDRITHLKGI